MQNTARLPLLARLEFFRGAVSVEEQGSLRDRLQRLGKRDVRRILNDMCDLAIEISLATSNRALTSKLAELGLDDRPMAVYLAAAWTARTLVFAELIDDFDSTLPKKWAADAALRWMMDFESHEVWLWPFESDPPWQDEDDQE